MFTSIIKKLLGTKIVECNAKHIIDDEYESSNIAIASQKE